MWGFGRWATAPAWVPVMHDVELESVSQVTDELDEAGIEVSSSEDTISDDAKLELLFALRGLLLGSRLLRLCLFEPGA